MQTCGWRSIALAHLGLASNLGTADFWNSHPSTEADTLAQNSKLVPTQANMVRNPIAILAW
jgi:hypothetical protein